MDFSTSHAIMNVIYQEWGVLHMKKFDIYKTIQLVIFILLTGIGLYIIFTDKELYQLVASNPHIRALCTLLWAVCGISFFFIFLDFTLFSTFKKDYKELDYAVSSDPVAGIANRYSCDTVIEKYLDKPLPADIGSVMFELTNIKEINDSHGHLQGNNLIREFSGILQSASMELAFVGRNGGNKFLAIIETCNQEKLETFLARVDERVKKYNQNTDHLPICYKYGVAFREDASIESITQLVALSNKRISE